MSSAFCTVNQVQPHTDQARNATAQQLPAQLQQERLPALVRVCLLVVGSCGEGVTHAIPDKA